ncbi:MAG: sigma-70 family RNA polymerase sigma factor [Pseudonocardiales bacterium]|nr:sigma-70 family RNA polymerase sigma factor [Pseudonocardiales bacterium]
MDTVTVNGVPADDAAASVADLLLGIRNGNQAAWDEILRRYSKLVATTVRSFRLQEADTLDAIQTTWLRLAENAHQVQFPQHLGGWLATTARRECIHILRQSKVKPYRFDTTTDQDVDPTAHPEQRVIDADITRIVWNLVNQLPPRHRTLLRALFTEQPQPYAEISRVTGIPAGGIGPTRARALAQLRQKLEGHELLPSQNATRKPVGCCAGR